VKDALPYGVTNELPYHHSTFYAKTLIAPSGIRIAVTGFNISPTVEIETPFTNVKFAARTTLERLHVDGTGSHVVPSAGVNTSPFPIAANFSTNTLPTGGDNFVGGVTQGHVPPLSTPKYVETGLYSLAIVF
jgi:hypothetical protein